MWPAMQRESRCVSKSMRETCPWTHRLKASRLPMTHSKKIHDPNRFDSPSLWISREKWNSSANRHLLSLFRSSNEELLLRAHLLCKDPRIQWVKSPLSRLYSFWSLHAAQKVAYSSFVCFIKLDDHPETMTDTVRETKWRYVGRRTNGSLARPLPIYIRPLDQRVDRTTLVIPWQIQTKKIDRACTTLFFFCIFLLDKMTLEKTACIRVHKNIQERYIELTC